MVKWIEMGMPLWGDEGGYPSSYLSVNRVCVFCLKQPTRQHSFSTFWTLCAALYVDFAAYFELLHPFYLSGRIFCVILFDSQFLWAERRDSVKSFPLKIVLIDDVLFFYWDTRIGSKSTYIRVSIWSVTCHSQTNCFGYLPKIISHHFGLAKYDCENVMPICCTFMTKFLLNSNPKACTFNFNSRQ